MVIFLNSVNFSDRFEPLALLEGATKPAKVRVPANQIEHKTLAELCALIPYRFPPEGFTCTAVIKTRSMENHGGLLPATDVAKNQTATAALHMDGSTV